MNGILNLKQSVVFFFFFNQQNGFIWGGQRITVWDATMASHKASLVKPVRGNLLRGEAESSLVETGSYKYSGFSLAEL